MPPLVEGLRVAVPALCFCGQTASRGSIYCTPQCAREDAFKSLTLGKPHESSKPAMAPLPTLPPGFFDLPPRRGIVSLSLNDPDEFDFAVDQGPFGTQPSAYATSTEQLGSSKSLPRSITPSVSSTTPSKRSKWRSHYQKAQERDSDASLEIPFLLVNTIDAITGEGAAQEIEIVDNDNALLTPTPPPGQREKGLPRAGSFGPMISPLLTSKDIAGNRSDTSSYYGGSVAGSRTDYNRSSSSSCISRLTSGTSSTSTTGTSDASPTKSEYLIPTSESRPRYGSAFGSVEDEKPLASPVVQLAIDLRETLLLARRESRRRSNTVATPRVDKASMNITLNTSGLNIQEQESTKSTIGVLGDAHRTKEIVSPSAWRTTSSPKRKVGGVPISRTKWSQFTSPTTTPERTQSVIPPVPPLPFRVPATSPTTHNVAGTVVKKTTIMNKARLPIGTPITSFKTPPPKAPSNTPSSAFNMSLQSKVYRAPAYAMSVPKIPTSTRTLHTSPSNRSLKSKKSEGHIRIPSVDDEGRMSLAERLKSSLDPTRKDLGEEGGNSSTNVQMIRSSTEPRNLRLTLKLEPVDLHPALEDPSATTPRITSAGSDDRSPSTSGGPSTPRPSCTVPDALRPFWLTSPVVTDSPTPITEQDSLSPLKRLRSFTLNSGTDLSCSSSGEELGPTTLCVAQRMTIRRSQSNVITQNSAWEATST